VLVIALLASTTAIGSLTYFLRPAPSLVFLPYSVVDYRDPQIPAPLMAAADLSAWSESPPIARSVLRPDSTQDWRALEVALADRTSSDSVLVYVSALASCDAGGEVLIWPRDVDLDNPESCLKLRDVLDSMRRCPAHQKLLALEITRPVADPCLGVLADEVAARAAEELKGLGDPRLRVLCASGPGEVAFVSDTFGRSVFNYYLEEGLRGWADADARGEIGDGVVSVEELHRYVLARVDDWAQRNRSQRQRPLLSAGDDFPLVKVAHRRGKLKQARRELPAAKTAKTYPEWLLQGWKLHDLWWADGTFRDAPRLFHRLEADLLDAEREWRGGAETTARERLDARRKELQQQLERGRQIPAPINPRSLGIALALGQKPDDDVTIALKKLILLRNAPLGDRKPDDVKKTIAEAQADFLTKTKDRSDFALAWAAFEAVAADRPRPGTFRFLDSVLAEARVARKLLPQPLFAETSFLQDLAELAGRSSAEAGPEPPPRFWPEDIVQRALFVLRQQVQAESRLPGKFTWLRPALEAAAQQRHIGHVLLRAPTFVARDEVDRAWQKAESAYQKLNSYEVALEEGRRRLDEALVFLPAYVAYLEAADESAGFSSFEGQWQDAVQKAHDGLALFETAPDDRVGALDATVEVLEGKARQWSELGQGLGVLLDQLRRPFASAHVGALIGRSQHDVGAPVAIEIEALLRSPFPSADDRARLWKALRDLSQRLHRSPPTERAPAAATAEAVPAAEAVASRQALNRARRSNALLTLGGLEAAALPKLPEIPPEGKAAIKTRVDLARAVRESWARRLPDHFHKQTDLAARDRLGRVIPPRAAFPPLDADPLENPTVRRRAEQAYALWTWFAERYRYEKRDLGDPPFYAAAAREFAGLEREFRAPEHDFRMGTGLPSETYLRIEGDSGKPTLSPAGPDASANLRFTLFSPSRDGQVIEVRTLKPISDRLKVGLLGDDRGADSFRPLKLTSTGAQTAQWSASLAPGATSGRTLSPEGFLVQARLGDRFYHFGVPLAVKWADERPQIVLDADPTTPRAPLDAVKLRPVKARQPFYLYVRNPTDSDKNVLVELRAGDALLAGGEAKLTVAKGETKRVTQFSPTAPKSPAELPEFTGPLEIRLLDATAREELDRKTIPVSIRTPTEYVQITDVSFDPPGAAGVKNRLACKVRGLVPFGDAPCVVELVLLPASIPGYTAPPGNALLQSALQTRDQVVELFAEDLALDPAADEMGTFYLNIDGLERAVLFRAAFAREGLRQAPREADQPSLALEAPPYVRSGSPLEVGVKADNAPPRATLEVSLGSIIRGNFVPERRQIGLEPKRRRIGAAMGNGGELLFDAILSDWTVAFDTEGIGGPRTIRGRMLHADGREVRSFLRDVTLIDTPPRNPQFVDLPPRAAPGSSLPVTATAIPTRDGIESVTVFVGKPVAGKVPQGAVPIDADLEPKDLAGSTWVAKLLLPKDKLGPIDISALFVNRVGLSSTITQRLELYDPAQSKRGKDAAAKGRLTGTVLEGTRPQANLDVMLRDARGALKDRVAKTGADGTYAFEGVDPGTYVVSARKLTSSSPSYREATVVVTPGLTTEVPLELLR
jgi:hypothetical protein